MAKWIKTGDKGVRYREHATRKHGIMKDRYYVYNYRIGGELIQEAVGWASEGVKQNDVADTRHEMKQSAKNGGYRTLKEKLLLADEAMSFQKLVEEWDQEELKGKKCRDERLRLLKKDVLPLWGKLKVENIKKRDVVLLRDKIKKRAPVTANRVHGALTRLFNFAEERGIIDFSPANNIRKIKEQGRARVLLSDEIKLLWEALDIANKKFDIYRNSKLALKLILLTGQRSSEVCGMKWSEIKTEKFELENQDGEVEQIPVKVWNIPKEHRKSNEGNIVPLCPLALEILEQAKFMTMNRVLVPNNSAYVFHSARFDDGPISRHSLSSAVRRHWQEFGIEERFTPHDLRRTLRTRLADLKVNDMVAERVLGHKLQGILAIYNRHHYVFEKKDALQLWENRLVKIIGTGQTENGNVVSLDERRNHG